MIPSEWSWGPGRLDYTPLTTCRRSPLHRGDGDAQHVGRRLAGVVSDVLSEALRVAPGLVSAEIREIRVGLRPFAADTLPVLGPVPGVHGVFSPPRPHRVGAIADRGAVPAPARTPFWMVTERVPTPM